MARQTTTSLLLLLLWSTPLADSRVLDIFHISDLHLDSRYSPGGRADDYCHALGASTDDKQLEDVKVYEELDPAGDYRCDAPAVLVESAIKYLHQVKPNPDLIVWTGDSNPHWRKGEGPHFEYIYSNMRNISKVLNSYFPGVPVVPALGNHDTDPPDWYPDSNRGVNYTEDFYARYIEQASFGDFIKDTARETFKKCGYYSVRPLKDRIKFVVLNTNLYYWNQLLGHSDDPCDQVQWLEKELQESADSQDDQVFIAAHIPPGFHERNTTRPMFNVHDGDEIAGRMAALFRNSTLSAKVVAHFYGHTHTDSFRLFKDDSGRVKGVAFIQASVTPSLYRGNQPYGVNPSVRVYHFDQEQEFILDYQQHFLDLEEALRKIRGKGGSEEGGGQDRSTRNSKFLRHEEEERSKRDDTDEDREGDSPPVSPVSQDSRLVDGEDTNANAEGISPVNVADSSAEFDSASVTKAAEGGDVDGPPSEPAPPQPIRPPPHSPGAFNGDRSDDGQKKDDNSNTEEEEESLLDKLAGEWRWYYNATKAFGEQNLRKKNMGRLYFDMRHDFEKGEIFKLFYKHNTVNHVKDPKDNECDRTCWNNFTCAIVSFTKQELSDCLGQEEEQGEVGGGGDNDDEPLPSGNQQQGDSVEKDEEETEGNDSDAGNSEKSSSNPSAGTTDDDGGKGDSNSGPPNGKDDDTSPVHHVTSIPEDHSLRGAAIGFCIVIVLAIAIGGLLIFRRVQKNRYRAQEFLLTDSVFRYDGYAQVDAP